MKKPILFITLCLFSLSAPAGASDYNYCDVVLEQQLKSAYGIESLDKYRDYLRESLNYGHDRLAAYVTANDGSLPLPHAMARAIAEAEIADSTKRERFDASRAKYGPDPTLLLNRHDFDTLTADLVAVTTLRQWNRCRRDIGVFDNGVVYRIDDRDQAIFSITFTYLPERESDPVAIRVTGLTVTGGGVIHIPTRIREGMQLRRYTGYTQSFRRTETQSGMTVQVDFHGRPTLSVMVPGLTPQDIVPVGTIVPSLLPWERFVEHAGDRPVFQENTSKWAPCDGRRISGSALAGEGLTHAPDLRGLFLRGLNRFDKDEGEAVSSTWRDPEDRLETGEKTPRRAGSRQEGNVGEHGHKFMGGGSRGVTCADGGRDRCGLWHDGDHGQSGKRPTIGNPSGETRPNNAAVYYYIKIN